MRISDWSSDVCSSDLQARFTLGVPQLLGGIDVVIVAVGLFAVGETFFVAARHKWEQEEILPVKGSVWMTKEEWKRSWKPWLRGSALGFPFGALPAGGAEDRKSTRLNSSH